MDLFQRFALGEIDAFEILVRQFQGDIYAWIVRIVRDPGIAEDLTVETLWRAIGRGNSFGRMETSQLGRDGLPPTSRSTIFAANVRNRGWSQSLPERLRPIISSSRRFGKRSSRRFAGCQPSCR